MLPICKVLSQYSDYKFLTYDRVYLSNIILISYIYSNIIKYYSKLYKVSGANRGSCGKYDLSTCISWTGFAATWLLCHNAGPPPPPPPPPAPPLFTGLWIAPGAVKSMLGSNCRAVHCQRVNWLWCIRLWPSRVQILHQWSPLPTDGAGGSVGVGVVLVLVAVNCNALQWCGSGCWMKVRLTMSSALRLRHRQLAWIERHIG